MTEKQALFCIEYLKDLNATQAAIRAGYSQQTARSIGHECLTKPDIQAKISALKRERESRTLITADLVLRELAKIAFATVGDFLDWTDKSIKIRSKDEIGAESLAALESLVIFDSGRLRGFKIKMRDSIRALELLGRHLGIFEAKAHQQNDEERRRRLEESLSRCLARIEKRSKRK